jgi:DNA-binding CsgD family transcriptional regulator
VTLTDKEKLILKRLGEGVHAKLIAREVKLTDKSLSTYRMRIKRKLGAPTIIAAVKMLADMEANEAARIIEAASEGVLNP